MVTVHGNAVPGTNHTGPGIPLPRPTPGPRPAHRPWCVDCKTTTDQNRLDSDNRCKHCASAAPARAAAAERRRLADEADAKAALAAGRKTRPKPPRTDEPRPKATRVLDAHHTDVIRRYTAGETSRAIADTYGVGAPTVLSYLRDHGATIRARGGHPPKTGATT